MKYLGHRWSIVVVLSLCVTRFAVANPYFFDDFTTLDLSRWQRANWGQHGVFANDWSPDQVSVVNGTLLLTLQRRTSDNTWVSGQYFTQQPLSYGYYEARLKASGVPGVVNGFFVYTGPAEGTAHHEIDVEILGDNPRRMQVNYWTDGVEHPTWIDLGFNAAEDFHRYAIDWQANAIRWYVDEVLVHQETGTRGLLPSLPGKLMFNVWASRNTQGWSSDQYDGTTTRLQVDYATYAASAANALRLTTTTLAAGTVGQAYYRGLNATGGSAPYVWSLSAGALPPGLTLSSTGMLSGIPTSAGHYAFTVQVTDQQGSLRRHGFSITIQPAAATTNQVDVALTTFKASKTSLKQGKTATLTFTVKNNSTLTANNVRFLLPLPAHWTWVKGGLRKECAVTDQQVVCNLGNLLRRVSRSRYLYLTPSAPGTVTLNAMVVTDSGDSNLTNNRRSVSVTVQ